MPPRPQKPSGSSSDDNVVCHEGPAARRIPRAKVEGRARAVVLHCRGVPPPTSHDRNRPTRRPRRRRRRLPRRQKVSAPSRFRGPPGVEGESAVLAPGLDVSSRKPARSSTLTSATATARTWPATSARGSADLPVAFFSAASPPDVVARARTVGPVFAKPAELDGAVAWARKHAR